MSDPISGKQFASGMRALREQNERLAKSVGEGVVARHRAFGVSVEEAAAAFQTIAPVPKAGPAPPVRMGEFTAWGLAVALVSEFGGRWMLLRVAPFQMAALCFDAKVEPDKWRRFREDAIPAGVIVHLVPTDRAESSPVRFWFGFALRVLWWRMTRGGRR